MDHWAIALLSSIGTLVTAAVPLYIKFKNAIFSLDKKRAELDLALKAQVQEQSKTTKIDAEAEWKRILESRESEIAALRARDELQDKQIRDLYDKHLDCEKERARNEERIKAVEKHSDDKIKSLQDQIQDLKRLLTEKTSVSK